MPGVDNVYDGDSVRRERKGCPKPIQDQLIAAEPHVRVPFEHGVFAQKDRAVRGYRCLVDGAMIETSNEGRVCLPYGSRFQCGVSGTERYHCTGV